MLRNRALALLAAAFLTGCGGEPAKPAAKLRLKAKPAAVAPGGKGRATASGGTPPYTYSVAKNATGTRISKKSGSFRAGKKTGTDVLRATDAAGAKADARLTVRGKLTLRPRLKTVGPAAEIAFKADGGTPPYTFVFVVGKNGSGGDIDPETGAYVAGYQSGTDVVQVSDQAGGKVLATITVEAPPLVITPTTASLQPGESQSFSAKGGLPPYRFLLLESASGGQCNPDGGYVAGVRPGTDTVRVMDDAGQTADAKVTVQPRPVRIRPEQVVVEPGQTVDFLPEQGAPPYRFKILLDSSEGSHVEALSGRYTAGTRAGTDRIQVTDAGGKTYEAAAKVIVPPLNVDPFEGRVTAGATLTLRALGGIPPFAWQADGPTGGVLIPSRDGRTARYVAPVAGITKAGAEVRVRVKDHARTAQAATAKITVKPPRPAGEAADPGELVAPSAAGRSHRGPVAYLPIRQKLKNGMVLIVEENHTRPVCCISMAIKGGSATDGDKPGLTTLCADLLGERSADLPAGEFRERIRAVGGKAWINNKGGESFTDRVCVEIEVRPAHLRTALETLQRAYAKPEPTAAILKKIQGQWIQLVQKRAGENTSLAWDALQASVFRGHPYASPWQGTEAGHAAITLEDVQKRLAEMASPARTTLVVSGDVNRKEVLEQAGKLFGALPPGSKPEPRVPPPEAFAGPEVKVIRRPGGACVLMAGFTVPGLMHPDRVSLELLSKVIEYQVKLDVLAVDKVGDYAEANVDLFADLGVLWVIVMTSPENVWKAEASLLKAIRKVRDGSGDAQEKEAAKAAAKREKQRLVMQEIVKREQARHRAFRMAKAESAHGIRYALGVLQRIRNTTPHDIEKAAQQYIRLENFSLVRVLPEAVADASESTLAGLKAERLKLQTDTKLTNALSKRLYSAEAVTTVFDDRGRLAEEWSTEAARTLDEELPNGLRIICREDRAVPLVNIGFYTPAGTAIDYRGQGALARILWSLPWRGTVHRHGGQIHDMVLAKGFQFMQNLTPDFSAIVATGMTQDAEDLATLVGEILAQPRLDAGAFLDLKRAQETQIRTNKQSPQIQARDALRQALYAGHPYGYPIAGDERSLKQCDIWTQYELAYRCLRPDRTTVIAVGDMPVEEMKALLVKTLGGWTPPPVTATTEPVRIWKARPHPGCDLQVPVKGATITSVVRAVPTPGFGHSDYPALEMLRWMLHFRCRRDILEQRGLATEVTGMYHAWAEGGMLEVGVTCGPEHREEVAKSIKRHFQELRDNPITIGEVQRTRDWIAAYNIRRQQNGSVIAFMLGTYVRLGAGPNYEERFYYELGKITPGSLQAIAKKYLQDDAQVGVEAGKIE